MSNYAGRFNELGTTLRRITDILTDVENPNPNIAERAQNLCKLLYYTEPNPLVQPLSTPINPDRPRPTFESYSDVTKHIINKRIMLVPKIPEPDEVGGFVIAMLKNFAPSANKSFKMYSLVFDVIVKHDNWLLDDNLRPFSIMQQVDNLINGTKLSIGTVEFTDSDSIVLTRDFLGYSMVYRDASIN